MGLKKWEIIHEREANVIWSPERKMKYIWLKWRERKTGRGKEGRKEIKKGREKESTKGIKKEITKD